MNWQSARRIACGLALAGLLSASTAAATDFDDRKRYRDAVKALGSGQTATFKRLAKQLSAYKLAPYLDYHWANHRLSQNQLTTQDFLQFYQANQHIPATKILKRRWLTHLGKRRMWKTLRAHYEPTSNNELRCYYLRSLYGTGDKQAALELVADMWSQPRSQPKSCDPLFDVWLASEHFNDEVAWTRLHNALQARQTSLARYVSRLMTPQVKQAAEAYITVHTNPSRISRTSNYRTDTIRGRQIVVHGVSRLARDKPEAAVTAWQTYRQSNDFDTITVSRVEDTLALQLAEETSRFPSVDSRAQYTSENVRIGLAQAALTQQNWSELVYWIEQLEEHERQKSMWQYWLARALTEVMGSNDRASLGWQSLAQQRHYYGFLAAQRLGIRGVLNHRKAAPTATEVNRLRRVAGVDRSIELFAVDDTINGRREWFAALTGMTQTQQLVAAQLSQNLGLVTLSINSANIADGTDYLGLRFPVAYEQQFREAATATGLPVAQLISLARQESAMDKSARSHANARGLMQLLPSTARLVARRAGLPAPSTRSLYQPSTNIKLGSYHLAWLFERYDQQSPLAIAAYNAGEHRVDRWIKEADGVPMDVWIESIPFRETRNYVKNVLAFRYVYAELLNTPQVTLAPHEQMIAAE